MIKLLLCVSLICQLWASAPSTRHFSKMECCKASATTAAAYYLKSNWKDPLSSTRNCPILMFHANLIFQEKVFAENFRSEWDLCKWGLRLVSAATFRRMTYGRVTIGTMTFNAMGFIRITFLGIKLIRMTLSWMTFIAITFNNTF
jgi:hypothetical protein